MKPVQFLMLYHTDMVGSSASFSTKPHRAGAITVTLPIPHDACVRSQTPKIGAARHRMASPGHNTCQKLLGLHPPQCRCRSLGAGLRQTSR